ncbi:MAG: hypothetical protein KDC13_10265, partial [Bacteroidetes bacterium]|nr:hypothetical protein [Bacteroidota bacterium]
TMVVDLVAIGAVKHQAEKNSPSIPELMRENKSPNSVSFRDSTYVLAMPSIPAETGVPDQTQKTTFGIIASIILFVFVFLALFESRFLRDEKKTKPGSVANLSPLRMSVFILYFMLIISLPASFGIFGNVSKASVSVFLLPAIAGIAFIFHILLKRAENSFLLKAEIKPGTATSIIELAFPVFTVMLAFAVCIPAWTSNRFAELPVELILSYMVTGMIYVGRKTATSGLLQSSLVKNLMNA